MSINHTNWKLLMVLFSVRDWISLVPPTAAVAGLGYVTYLAFCPEARKCTKVQRFNKSIRLEDAKVADFVDIEDIADKAAFCRCWKSKNVWFFKNMYKIVHVEVLHQNIIKCVFVYNGNAIYTHMYIYVYTVKLQAGLNFELDAPLPVVLCSKFTWKIIWWTLWLIR